MFLEKIVDIKKDEIRRKKTPSRQREMEEMIPSLPLPRNFMESISQHPPIAVIAEIKRASPSVGVIKEDADLCSIVRDYQTGGACAISVLTEAHFFKGDLSYLPLIRRETFLPVLQKDFILDPFQIYEGRVSGADAVLLIASILEQDQLKEFADLVQKLYMVPLIEVHNESDLEKALPLHLPLIGINNRDLKTFEIDLKTTLRLRREIPLETKVISESGIKSSEDVRFLRDAGVDGILVGEILMRSSDPASKIKELLGR